MEYAIGGAALVLLLGIAWCSRAAWRMRVRKSAIDQRDQAIDGVEIPLRKRDDTQTLAQRFSSEHLITAEPFLDDAALAKLREEAEGNRHRLVRSYVPGHKQGGTVSYEKIHSHAP